MADGKRQGLFGRLFGRRHAAHEPKAAAEPAAGREDELTADPGLASAEAPDQVADDGFVTIEPQMTRRLDGTPGDDGFVGYNKYQRDPSLVRIVIPEKVRRICGSAFGECPNLEEVVIQGARDIESAAFYGCPRLAKVTLPDTLQKIGSSAFRNCQSLTSLALPEGVSVHGQAFDGCVRLQHIDFLGRPGDLYTSAFWNTAWLADQEGLIVIDDILLGYGGSLTGVLEVPDQVQRIASGAFRDCVGLTALRCGPKSRLREIGWMAFSGCTALVEVVLPRSLTTIQGGAFQGCTSLTSVKVPRNVKDMGRDAFSGCTNLAEVSAPDKYVGKSWSSWFSGTEYGMARRLKQYAQWAQGAHEMIRERRYFEGVPPEALALWDDVLAKARAELRADEAMSGLDEDEQLARLFVEHREWIDRTDDRETAAGDTYKRDLEWYRVPEPGKRWRAVAGILLHSRRWVGYDPEAPVRHAQGDEVGERIYDIVVFGGKDVAYEGELREALEALDVLLTHRVMCVSSVPADEAGFVGEPDGSYVLRDCVTGQYYDVDERYAGYNTADSAETYYDRFLVCLR